MAGVFTLRTRDDADAVMGHVQPGHRCIVVGGGLLGLELVAALQQRGARCELIHRSSRLMGRQLDATASRLLAEELSERGITLYLNESVASVHGDTNVKGVRSRNGRYFGCDALFFATGTTPNVELARQASLPCGHGVRVDDSMRTADPNVFAIGEIAEHRHRCYGTTPAAQDQALVAAAQMTGDTWRRYEGNIPFNVLKLRGFSLCSMGQVLVNEGDRGYEEITLLDESERFYQKCVVYRNRLVGALLVGDMGAMASLKDLITTGIELDDQRRTLLRSGGAKQSAPMDGELVCSCNQVGTGNLACAMAEGCDTLESLCKKTGAGLGCGSCKPEVAALLEGHHTPAMEGASA